MLNLARRTIIAAGGVLLSASALAAQGAAGVERQWSFGITGGATFPSGDFGDAAATGYNVGGLLEFKPAPGPLSFRIEGDFQQFGLSDDLEDLIEAVDGDTDKDHQIFSLIGNAVYRFGMEATTLRPYVTGGLGVYWLEFQGESASLSETKFGLNGGAGVELPLTGLTTFIEARYHTVFTEGTNTNFFPLRVGIRF